MAVNKIVLGGTTLIDITDSTADASTVLSGSTFYDKSGAKVTGECSYDSDTSDDTAAVAEILATKTAHARGAQLVGTMPNIGKQTGSISNKTDTITIRQGYHDGSAVIGLSDTAKAQLVASNIRQNTVVMGVTGTYAGDSTENRQPSKTVNPSLEQQTILPDSGYTCLTQVVVNAVPYTVSANAAGGDTVTIL